jgi:tetratricopeptide (TPR) repeat protein
MTAELFIIICLLGGLVLAVFLWNLTFVSSTRRKRGYMQAGTYNPSDVNDEIEEMRREASGDDAHEAGKKFERQLARFHGAFNLECAGRIEEAVKVYEDLLKDRFDESGPYWRMAIIYRKQNRYDDEIRVLEKGVEVFRNPPYRPVDMLKGYIDQYQQRIEKVRTLQRKMGGEAGKAGSSPASPIDDGRHDGDDTA